MELMETIVTPINADNYTCKKCDFTCRKHSDWLRHTSTRKHNMETNGNTKTPFYATSYHICIICDKEFKSSSGLWKHKKKCNGIEENKEVNNELNEKNTIGVETDKELLIKILLKNQEIMDKLMEIIPNTGNNSHDLSSK
jgi:hypothetical protein